MTATCAAPSDSYLDEVITDDQGGRMFVCSDTDFCAGRRAAGMKGRLWAPEPEGVAMTVMKRWSRPDEPLLKVDGTDQTLRPPHRLP
jgi:hypothetical protein